MIRVNSRLFGLSFTMVASIVGSPMSHAADPSSDSDLQEIVVTAQFRAEDVQRVPIQINTVTTEQMKDYGVETIDQVALLSSSITLGQEIGYPLPYIRGIGSDLATAGTEDSVSLYVDGVYQSRNIALGYDLNDVDHVEVLKGPQGALYGRNATGGVINVVSKRPDPGPLSGEAEISTGNYGQINSKLYISGGSDTLSASLAVTTRKHDGFYRNLDDGANLNFLNNYIVSTKFLWNISSNQRVFMSLERAEFIGDMGTATNQIGVGNVFASVIPGARWINQPWVTYLGSDGVLGIQGQGNILVNNNRTKGLEIRWESEYDMFHTNLLLGDHELDAQSGADGASTSAYILDFGAPYEHDEDYSVEYQLISNDKGPFTWLAGASFVKEDNSVLTTVDLGPDIAPMPTSVDAIRTPTQLGDKAEAGYGLVGYKFGADESSKIEYGVRYTTETKFIEGSSNYYDVAQGIPFNGYLPYVVPLLQVPAPYTHHHFANTSSTFTVTHDFSSTSMAYARFAQAFKSGAFNQTAPTNPVLQPETVNSGELGFKSTLGRVRMSSAIWTYDYKDLQVGQVSPNGGATDVNIPKSEARGAELDLDARVTDALTAQFDGTYLHNRYVNVAQSGATFPGVVGGVPGNYTPAQLGEAPPDLNGDTMIRSPKFAASLSGVYTARTSFGQFELAPLLRFTSRQYFDIANGLSQGAYSVLNASLTFRSLDGRWYTRLYGTNLTDKGYYTFASRISFGDFASYGDPRVYGIAFGAKL